jgi:hypothetical protein
MVKNTTGGSGHKSQARKIVDLGYNHDPIPDQLDEFERLATVTKLFGNGMCQVLTSDNLLLLCHIRGKFRGRNKKNNLLSLNSSVLIGLRQWENPPKTSDLILVKGTYGSLKIPPLNEEFEMDLDIAI